MNTYTLSLKKILYAFIFIIIFTNSQSLKSNPKYITKSKKYYIVKHGDNLTKISKKKEISIKKLKLYNNLKSDKIFIGQKIYLQPKNIHKNEYITQKPIPVKKYHKVKKGDTLYKISKLYGITVMDLVEINELDSFDIKIGEKIWLNKNINNSKTTIHKIVKNKKNYTVKRGDNLTKIAKKYNMSLKELKNLNNIKKEKIFIGQKLYVYKKNKKITHKEKRKKNNINIKFEPPIVGEILSEFGTRNGKMHKGIDIGAITGEPIKAVADGKVVFCGQQRGYGNTIVLEHKQGIMTIYAHNESNLVRNGDTVTKGQPIATIGQTGNATAPHVHFEFRIKGKAYNPKKYINF